MMFCLKKMFYMWLLFISWGRETNLDVILVLGNHVFKKKNDNFCYIFFLST